MSSNSSTWWVYMVLTSKQTLYTGIATDAERRFKEHLDVYNRVANARGAKFFRTVAPVELVYKKSCQGRSEASRLEIEIKKLTRKQKLMLVANFNNELIAD